MLHPSTILPPLTCCATARRGTGLWRSRPFCWCLPASACRQVGQKDGAALLTVVLAVVALGVPAVYFWTFFHSLSLQIKKMGLPRPFYRLLLDDDGLSVWMAGEQDKPEASRQVCVARSASGLPHPQRHLPLCPAESGLSAERQPRRAMSLLQASLPAERCTICDKNVKAHRAAVRWAFL